MRSLAIIIYIIVEHRSILRRFKRQVGDRTTDKKSVTNEANTRECLMIDSPVTGLTVYSINVKKTLIRFNSVLRTTLMTPVKPQISKLNADKLCQVGFNVLRRLYSRAFVERVK